MDKFLETQNLETQNHEEIESLKRPVTSKEIESVIKTLPTKKCPGPGGFTGESYQHLKKNTNSSQICKKKKRKKERKKRREYSLTMSPLLP